MTENSEAKEMMNDFKFAWTNPLQRATNEVSARLVEKRKRLAHLELNFDAVLDSGEMEPEQLWDAIDALRFQISELEWVLGEK